MTIDSSTTTPFGGDGYACGICGTWVLPGSYHNCQSWQPTQPTVVGSITSHSNQSDAILLRIAAALERIAKALETSH